MKCTRWETNLNILSIILTFFEKKKSIFIQKEEITRSNKCYNKYINIDDGWPIKSLEKKIDLGIKVRKDFWSCLNHEQWVWIYFSKFSTQSGTHN